MLCGPPGAVKRSQLSRHGQTRKCGLFADWQQKRDLRATNCWRGSACCPRPRPLPLPAAVKAPWPEEGHGPYATIPPSHGRIGNVSDRLRRSHAMVYAHIRTHYVPFAAHAMPNPADARDESLSSEDATRMYDGSGTKTSAPRTHKWIVEMCACGYMLCKNSPTVPVPSKESNSIPPLCARDAESQPAPITTPDPLGPQIFPLPTLQLLFCHMAPGGLRPSAVLRKGGSGQAQAQGLGASVKVLKLSHNTALIVQDPDPMQRTHP